MIVNISPTHASAQETACSFRFANQVIKEKRTGQSRNTGQCYTFHAPSALICFMHKGTYVRVYVPRHLPT